MTGRRPHRSSCRPSRIPHTRRRIPSTSRRSRDFRRPGALRRNERPRLARWETDRATRALPLPRCVDKPEGMPWPRSSQVNSIPAPGRLRRGFDRSVFRQLTRPAPCTPDEADEDVDREARNIERTEGEICAGQWMDFDPLACPRLMDSLAGRPRAADSYNR